MKTRLLPRSMPRRIVETALRAIFALSRYAEMVRDLLAWHQADGWPST